MVVAPAARGSDVITPYGNDSHGAAGAASITPKFLPLPGVVRGFAGGVVNWYYNPAGEPAALAGEALGIVAAAAEAWSAVCNVHFQYQGAVAGSTALAWNGRNVVSWGKMNEVNAAWTATYYGADGVVAEADIMVGPPAGNKEMLALTMLHEWGHAIGLNHSDRPGAVMSGPPTTSYTYGNTLTLDDIEGCQALYDNLSCTGPKPAPLQYTEACASPYVGTLTLEARSVCVNGTWTRNPSTVIAGNCAMPPTPVPVCTATASSTVPRVGTTVTLTANCSNNPTGLAWTGGCSTSGATFNTCIATATTAGAAVYTVSASNAGGRSADASATVQWQPAPAAPPEPVPPPVVTPPPGAVPPVAMPQAQVPAVMPATHVLKEYYNATADDYFITADGNEQRLLEQGTSWQPTGARWGAWGSAVESAVPVCRFYGDWRIDPATGKRIGPDVHFYSGNDQECAQLSGRYPVWVMETASAFFLELPVGNACAGDRTPLVRWFRPWGDPVHRFTGSPAAASAMLANAWIPEGTAFCAPPMP